MSKRVLITGASGFVGANLARRLLHDGHEIHVLLRAGHRRWRLDEVAADLRCHEADLQDGEAVQATVAEVRPDWVFHLGAYGAYPSQQDMERMVSTNLLGCVSLLNACLRTGVGAFVNSGSSSEYGLKDHAPDEEEALAPNSPYAIAKAAATHYCRLIARNSGMNIVTLRLYSVYGPYEDPGRLIPTLIAHGFRGELPPLVAPETARDFIYVEDAVDAMVKTASAALPSGTVYNVCTGIQTTLREAVEISRQVLNVRAEPAWSTMAQRSWDTSVWVGTGARLERDLDWRAATSFRKGFAQTVDWFRHYSDTVS